MAEAEDYRSLLSKRKAVTALLSYAVWQERDRKPEMLDMILRVARASRKLGFMWDYVDLFAATLFSEASSRAIILVSPRIHWDLVAEADRGDLVQGWAARASVVLHTEEVVQDGVSTLLQIPSEEVAQDVVITLLRIASEDPLVRYIPVNVWSWLTKRPSLPPACTGSCFGTRVHTVKAVRGLKDIEILKSYLLLVWSEWNHLYLDGYGEMCTLIGEDFCGIGMEHHRADLIHRLDHVLGQMDHGLEYLKQRCPELDEDYLGIRKNQYRKLRETLLEIDSRTPRLTIMLLRVLTHTPSARRIPRNIYVRTPSPMSIVPRLERLMLPLPPLFESSLCYHSPYPLHLSTHFSSSLSRLTCSHFPCRIIAFCILFSCL